MRWFSVMLALVAVLAPAWVDAQTASSSWMPARANVVAYDDDRDIERLAYRESPYYLELTGSWKQQQTDSSVLYTKQINVEKTWRDYLVTLNVRCGRACRVLLDDVEVGYAGDSRHWNEFSLNHFLRYGKSMKLTIEALRHSREAQLEDSSLRVGLNGEPFLLFKSDPGVADLSLVASYDNASTEGTLTADVLVNNSRRKGKYYVEVEIVDPQGHQLDRMGRWVVFENRSEEHVEVSRTWTGVAPWSAEAPNLYTAIVRLRNAKMEIEETVGSRFGFRKVAVHDGVLTVNGQAITLKGIIYGQEHTEGLASRERMKRDVETMKQLNINAVRTSRYSPMDPYFYELCDRYGLYVICDANLMPASTQYQAVATDQEYAPLFEHRVENLYEKYKNYPSIICWSLGNSRDNGVCMNAAYRRLKYLDKERPVVFAGAEYGETTDMVALVYPSVATMKQAADKKQARPMVMLAAVDAAHFSDMEPLWSISENTRSQQGGFVDVWPLTATMQSELSHLYQPFDVRLSKISKDEGEFIVFNRNDFTNLGGYSLDYVIYTNLRSNIVAGDLPVAVKGGESDVVSMRIPRLDLQQGEELFVRFNLRHRANGAQAATMAGKPKQLAGTVVFPLVQSTLHSRMLNTDDGMLPAVDTTQPIVPVALAFEGHADWLATVVEEIRRMPSSGVQSVDAMVRYTSPSGEVMCDVRQTCVRYGTGDIVVDFTIAPADNVKGALQPLVRVQYKNDSVEWFGLDREVLFSRNSSGVAGTYIEATTKQIERKQVRWCSLHGGGEPLFMRVIGEQVSMKTTGEGAELTPSQSPSFRLHLRAYGAENPIEFMSTDFPRVSTGMLEPPTISASEIRFSQPLVVTLSAQEGCDIRYTLDGSEPDEHSPLYARPFTLTTTTMVKARALRKDMPSSFVASRKFNYDYIIHTRFSRKPSNPYNAGADSVLFDGEKSEVEDLSHGWLGFSGSDLTCTVELSKQVDVEYIKLRYAHNPSLWAFAPRKVKISYSTDGSSYSDPKVVEVGFDPESEENSEARVVEMSVPLGQEAVGFVKVEMVSLSQLPAWHRGKGLKPWLLMDEIEVSESVVK